MDYDAMGKRIRGYRKSRGITQATLAESVGISTSFIGHIERGTRITSLETLVRLSQVLEVSLDSLVMGSQASAVGSPSTSYKMRVLNDVLRVLNEHSGEWLRDE